MKKYELNYKDYKRLELGAALLKLVLFPVFLMLRIFCWVWDYNYYEHLFKPLFERIGKD